MKINLNRSFCAFLMWISVVHGSVALASVLSPPTTFMYQGRILSQNGQPLEYQAVAFEFSILSPNGSCLIYREQVNGVDMRNSKGIFDVAIGTGVKSYPVGPSFGLLDAFSNLSGFTCFGGATYTPLSGDGRLLRVQFFDGNGWKLISPDTAIRSVPFAGFALGAQKLGNYSAGDFVLRNAIPSCAAGEVITFDGNLFSCVVDGSGGAGMVTSVTGTAPISVVNSTTAPVISVAEGTAAAKGVLQVGTGLSVAAGVVSLPGVGTPGTYGSATQVPVLTTDAQGRITGVTNTAIHTSPVGGALSEHQVWIGDNANTAQARFFGVGDLRNSSGNQQIPSACSSSQTMTWSSLTDQFSCTTIALTTAQISDFPTLGTAAGKNFGAGAGNLVELDGSGKIPSGMIPAGVTSVNLASDVTGVLPIANGGTGASSQSGAINNLLPVQTGNANKILQTDGTHVSWTDKPVSGITALTGDVTAAGSGSVAATLANDAVTSAKILDGTILGADMDFTGVNTATTSLILKDSAGKFFNFACSTVGHVPTWTVTGFACQAPAVGGDGDFKKDGSVAMTGDLDLGGQYLTSSDGIIRMTASVGIGTDPQSELDVAGTIRAQEICDETGANCKDISTGWSSGGTDSTKVLKTGDSMSGNLYVGPAGVTHYSTAVEHSAGDSYSGYVSAFKTAGDTHAPFHAALYGATNTIHTYGIIGQRRTNSAWTSATSAVANGTYLPGIGFAGQTGASSGAQMTMGASILAVVNGAVSSGVLPTDIIMNTSVTNSTGLQERLRITSTGRVGIGTANPQSELDVAGTVRAQEICDESGANCKDLSTGWSAGLTTVNLASDVTGVLPMANGGTGASSQSGAINNLLPAQTGNANKILQTDGTNVSWVDTPSTGITALTGEVTASGSGSVAATIANNAVTSTKILNATILGEDLNFTGVNTATSNFVMKDATGKFYDFACATTGHVPTWTVAGFACQAPSLTETDPKVGANTLNMLSKWNGSALVASGVYESGGNVGIGTASPGSPLHVIGAIRMVDGNQAAGKVLTSDANGVASWQLPTAGAPSGSNTQIQFNNSGAFGGSSDFIWNNSTGYAQVGSGASNEAFARIGKTSVTLDSGYGDTGTMALIGQSLQFTTNMGSISMTSGGVTSMMLDNTGHLGIGTNNPTATLHVVKTTSDPVFQVDDQIGDATPFIITASGNVGIGTTNPQAKLDVNGIIRATEICDESGANCKDISTGWAAGLTTVNLASDVTGTLPIANGGTGATSQSGAINNLLPTQTGNANKILQTNGTNVSWVDTPATGITALTGEVTASGTGSVAATIASNAVTSAKILNATILGEDLNFTGVNTATSSFVMKDSTGKFYNFACSTTGHVPTWTASGFACQAPASGAGDFLANGSVAMTGDLNVGGNSITNAKGLSYSNKGLDLNSSGTQITLYSNSGDIFLRPTGSGSTLGTVVVSSGSLTAYDSAGTRSLYFNSSGFVLGNDVTPDAKLEVIGNGSSTALLVQDSGDGDTTPFIVTNVGNVGIGTASPGSGTKLRVEGQISSKSNSGTAGAIDWTNGNAQTTSYNCAANLTFANLRDGGSYTLAVTSTATTQCNFSTSVTGDDAGTVSYRFLPANTTRTASSHTIYSLQRIGSVVYVSWMTGF